MGFANIVGLAPTLYPSVRLRWAPTTQPTAATQTYTDITDHLRGFDWGYGRNDELARFEAGTGSVILNNRDRAFDPSYAAGPYFGNIKPRKAFELVAQFNSITYPVFVAYARGFPQSYPSFGKDSLVKIDLVDAFGVLQGVDLVIGFTRPAELSGARLAAVFDAVGIPMGNRDIDTGTVMVDAITIDSAGTSALDHAKSVAFDSEFGELFVAKDGKITFHDWTRRLNVASSHTFGDNAGELPYGDGLEPHFDDNYLWNYVRATGSLGGDQASVAVDAASQADYFPLTKAISSQLVSGSDLDAIVQRYIVRYAQPALRAPSLPLQGAMAPSTLWPAALDLEVSDCVTVKRRPLGGMAMTLTQFVEGVSHSCPVGGPWTTNVPTSPTDTSTFMVADDPVLGLADSGNLAS